MARDFYLVVACSKNKGIGKDGNLPWHIPEEMTHFKTLTLSGNCINTVIMGRKTWHSIPQKFRPLANRKNIVISSTLHEEGLTVVPDLHAALAISEGNVFVIGGSRVFEECLSPPLIHLCKQIYITRIAANFECDVFFPSPAADIFQEGFMPGFELCFVSKTYSHKSIPYDYAVYQNNELPKGTVLLEYPKHEEYQYLELVKAIIKKTSQKEDRTKIGTFSMFGTTCRYDLESSIPVFTTKLVFWKAVVEELLWFIRGSTNANELASKGVHIWDANGSREFLDDLGFVQREVGDLGPVYGFQWRHFGAEYTNMHADYSGQGVDQLAEVIKLIRTDPNSRRIIMSAWNPKAQSQMALPPCHVFSQFYVEDNKLSCLMYQRSGDMGLGVPFNVASYSLLTCMIAQVCGLQRGQFIHVIGDTHVYSNHVEPLNTQVRRNPLPFPTLSLNPEIKEIFDFTVNDIKLEHYNKHPKIQMEMAV